jgi:hypothetical protein
MDAESDVQALAKLSLPTTNAKRLRKGVREPNSQIFTRLAVLT